MLSVVTALLPPTGVARAIHSASVHKKKRQLPLNNHDESAVVRDEGVWKTRSSYSDESQKKEAMTTL